MGKLFLSHSEPTRDYLEMELKMLEEQLLIDEIKRLTRKKTKLLDEIVKFIAFLEHSHKEISSSCS